MKIKNTTKNIKHNIPYIQYPEYNIGIFHVSRSLYSKSEHSNYDLMHNDLFFILFQHIITCTSLVPFNI